VVFSRGVDDEIDLFLYTLSSQTVEQLTSLPHKEYDATWSPDGDFIAFAHNQNGGENYDVKAIRLSDRQIFSIAQAPDTNGIRSLRYLSWGESRPYDLAAQDLCPDDPLKVVAGTCGCGVADLDSDGDGRPDCVDICPQDPAAWEGACPVVSVPPTPTPVVPKSPRLALKRSSRGTPSLVATAPKGLSGPYVFSIQMGKRVVTKNTTRPQVKVALSKNLLARATVQGAQTEVSSWSAWKRFKVFN